MKTKYHSKTITLLLALFLVLPMHLAAQTQEDAAPPQQMRIYSQEELDKLLAPIALYPDTVLSQILMASTYPLEVVEADRWLKKNPGLSGDALDTALQTKSWDVSVKSLCHFPRVLGTMSDNLALTNDLGNAFLGQEEQVMDTIQKLRAKAQAEGNLSSTDKLKVDSQTGAIAIEPASPEVVYVPAYDPCWVYGPWWYPVCSPLWFWYPGIVISAGFFFGPSIFIGPLGPWCGFHWRQHEVFIDINRTLRFHRPSITRMHGGMELWVHNPIHRRGITYRSPEIARRFGQTPRPGVEARKSFRGFAPAERVPGAKIGPAIRPQTRQPATGPPNAGPGARTFEQPARPQPIRPEIQPRSNTPGITGRPSVQPQRGNAFESFESHGGEVIRHSDRGFNSMSGGSRGGGFQRGGTPSGGSSIPPSRSSGSLGGGGGVHGGAGSHGGGRRR